MHFARSSRYLFGAAAALALGALTASPALQAQTTQTVRIGHAAPQSGAAAHWGKDNENGVRRAMEDRTAYGKGSADDFGVRIKAMGAKIVAHEYTTDKSTDFSAILTSLRGKTPDLLFYGGMDAQGGLIARQMVQLGVKAKRLESNGLCADEIIKISGGAVKGVLYCTRGAQALEQRPRGAAFAPQYKSRFNTEVLTYGPFLYDSMMVVAAAMKKADSVEPANYLPMVREINYDGLSKTFNFHAHGKLKSPQSRPICTKTTSAPRCWENKPVQSDLHETS